MRSALRVLFVLTIAALAQPARADAVDPLIEGAKLCTGHLSRYEREYGIPTHLLSAIASTESGRYHDGLHIKLPWPWTINANGKGYFFETKEQAIAMVHKLKSQGIQSIDVGCMQVNLYHHPQAFASLDQAFEPQSNIAYAASFLRELYQEEGSWKKAAGDYHSKTPALGSQYVGLVYDSWRSIIDKLRAARLQLPDQKTNLAMNEMKNEASAPRIVPASFRQVSSKSVYQPVRMNSISISKKDDRNENGIIVVRPKVTLVDTPSPTEMADASVTPATMAVAPAPDAKVIRLGDQHVVTTPVTSEQKSGPRFIFSD